MQREGLARGRCTEAVRSPLHAHLVQQGIGGVKVALALPVGIDFTKALVHRIQNFLGVNGQLQRLQEPDVADDFLPGFILVVEVDHHVCGVDVHRGQVRRDAGFFLVLLVQGNVVDGGRFTAEVRLARDIVHLCHLHVLHQRGSQLVHIGQLVTLGVHLMIVGVALKGGDAAIAGHHDPWV